MSNFSTSSKSKSELSPRQRRFEEILMKLDKDEILSKIPDRMNPNIEFSEDEDEDNDQLSDELLSKTDNTVVARWDEMSSSFVTALNTSLDNELYDVPKVTSYCDTTPETPPELQRWNFLKESKTPAFGMEMCNKVSQIDINKNAREGEFSNVKKKEQSNVQNAPYSESGFFAGHQVKDQLVKQKYGYKPTALRECLTKYPDSCDSAGRKVPIDFKPSLERDILSRYQQSLDSAAHAAPSIDSHSNLRNKLDDKQVFVVHNKTYSVLSDVGSGGSCKVYSVFDEEAGVIRAIKHINLAGIDDNLRKEYIKEVQYLNMMQNSHHVIMMYDFEFKGNELFIVLEKGETDFAHFLMDEKRRNNLTPLLFKFYWSQMLNAVSEIHSMGIVHCDLKPANFLFVNGHLKLIDFGIASSVPQDKTSMFRDTHVGTINFMSPEALNCQETTGETGTSLHKVGMKCDVWSLGCILYLMIYGHPPFANFKNTFSKIKAIMDPNYKILFPEQGDKNLLEVMKMCLEYDPRKRATIADLLKHPYLIESEKDPENISTEDPLQSNLIDQLRLLTPRRRNTVEEMIKQLSKEK